MGTAGTATMARFTRGGMQSNTGGETGYVMYRDGQHGLVQKRSWWIGGCLHSNNSADYSSSGEVKSMSSLMVSQNKGSGLTHMKSSSEHLLVGNPSTASVRSTYNRSPGWGFPWGVQKIVPEYMQKVAMHI